MSDAKSPPDLSMDEILATIRRIIAEDERSGAHPGESDDDVLELTEALNEDGTVRHLAPREGSPSGAGPEPPASVAAGESESPADARPEPVDARATPGAAPDQQRPPSGTDGRLVSEVSALAAAAALARLAATPRPRRDPPLVGDRPLEDIVRELLRPLLQTWLDENLPAIVERLVAAEIARIANKSGPS
jgi:uncharacterized protein